MSDVNHGQEILNATASDGWETARCFVAEHAKALIAENNKLKHDLAIAEAGLAELRGPRPGPELMNDELPNCSKCGGKLWFSARAIGDGMCHPCGHADAAKAKATIADLTTQRDALIEALDASGCNKGDEKPNRPHEGDPLDAIESVIDDLIEVGNGTTQATLHDDADLLMWARDVLRKARDA